MWKEKPPEVSYCSYCSWHLVSRRGVLLCKKTSTVSRRPLNPKP